MEGWWIPLLGTAAAVCTTGSFVPQVVKIWREGDTAAISKRTYATLTVAAMVWTFYGWLIDSWPLIGSSVVASALCGTVLVLKTRTERLARASGHAGGSKPEPA